MRKTSVDHINRAGALTTMAPRELAGHLAFALMPKPPREVATANKFAAPDHAKTVSSF